MNFGNNETIKMGILESSASPFIFSYWLQYSLLSIINRSIIS